MESGCSDAQATDNTNASLSCSELADALVADVNESKDKTVPVAETAA